MMTVNHRCFRMKRWTRPKWFANDKLLIYKDSSNSIEKVSISFVCILSLVSYMQHVHCVEPKPIPSASYISLDGLTLVINFDGPVSMGASLEAFAAHRSATSDSNPSVWLRTSHQVGSQDNSQSSSPTSNSIIHHQAAQFCPASLNVNLNHQNINNNNNINNADSDQSNDDANNIDQSNNQKISNQQNQLIQGIQLCAKLLTSKSLKILYRYKLYNCIWATQTQLIIQIVKPAKNQIRLAFQSSALGDAATPSNNPRSSSGRGTGNNVNYDSTAVTLSRLPLESLGVPLVPRIAITGPNQVPICGQFTLSAHLWSPFGTEPGESVSLQWSVERLAGSIPINTLTSPSNGNGNSNIETNGNSSHQANHPTSINQLLAQQEAETVRWQRLQELVGANKANNLVLDAQLLEIAPQVYNFKLTATFTTSLKTITLNGTHKVTRLDYETPIGALYGTHLLSSQSGALKTSRDIILLADVQLPECASDIKQIGMYWQVSDSRVKFDQTYAPFYLARAGSLPEQSTIEFRLNLFYGIRLKRYSSANTQLVTSDSQIESKISGGLLALSVSSNLNREDSKEQSYLQFYGGLERSDKDNFNYQWSCFDGKSALSCTRSKKSSSSTSPSSTSSVFGLLGSSSNTSTAFEISPNRPPISNNQNFPLVNQDGTSTSSGAGGTPAGTPLIERHNQGEPILKFPLDWLEPGSQLWFGLQRFDRRNSAVQSSSQTEYALVQVGDPLPCSSSKVSIGPILVGHFRAQLSVRNPLTGALILPSGTPIVIVGRAGPYNSVNAISWHSPDYLYPLHWTLRNETDALTGEPELLTELHLNPQLLVPNAHYQFQLNATMTGGSTSSVSLGIDFMAGIGQCRVEASQSKVSNSLLISIDYCNIPLDLSPITYQIYAAETSELAGLNEGGTGENSQFENNPMSNNHISPLSVMDELELQSQMQPLTTPQLSPSFYLSHSMATAILSNELANSEPQTRISDQIVARFGARVCDRLQSCRMFFSNPFSLRRSNQGKITNINDPSSQGLNGTNQPPFNGQPSSQSPQSARLQTLQEQQESQVKLTQSLRNMIEAARKINTGGNSIAAISTLSGAIDLAQKLLASTGGTNQRVRDLYQLAIRDVLHFCSSSMQRHFHFTDSGQANLVTHTLAKVLSLPATMPLESKFKAIRLMAQITRRTINDQLALRQTCIADMRSLQEAYETLLNSFNHYTLSMSNADNVKLMRHHNHNKTTNQADESPIANRLLLVIPNSQLPSSMYQPVQLAANYTSNPISNNKNHFESSSQHNHNITQPGQTLFSSLAWNRRRNDELLLSYLRLIRIALRTIQSAAAIQLPLGGQELFHYVYNGSPTVQPEASNQLQASRARVAHHVGSARLAMSPSTLSTATTTPPSDIVTSLRHLTQIPRDNIVLNLHQFGSISVRLSTGFVDKFNQLLADGSLKCRNESESTRPLFAGSSSSSLKASCSSFVMSVTSFAGKSTHRALDDGLSLRVPIVELAILSNIDGSNLIELMANPIWATQSQTTVIFSVGQDTAENANSDDVSDESEPTPATNRLETQKLKQYKCYRFDEEINEWSYVVDGVSSAAPISANSEGGEPRTTGQTTNQISCSFKGLGTFAAFSGKPPPIEGALSSTLVMSAAGFGGIVILLSLLGCLAGEWKHSIRSRRRESSVTISDTTNGSCDSGSYDEQQHHYEHPAATLNQIDRYNQHVNRPGASAYPLRI